MRISVTERGSFKRCRRAWDFGSYNRQALSRVVNSVALNVGTLHHKALEEWTNQYAQGNEDFDVVEYYVSISADALQVISEHYKQKVGVKPDKVELNKFYEAVDIGMKMIKNYRDYWGTPIQKGFRVVAMEQTCVVPIPHTEHMCTVCSSSGNLKGTLCTHCNGEGWLQHEMEFTLDGLIMDPRDRLYVLERKTYGNRPNEHTLRHNDQFVAYLWGVTQLGLGKPVGIAYDGAWKRADPPRGKTMDDLFYRTLLERRPIELENFQHQLQAEVLDMVDPTIYTNRRWEGCHDCSFQPLCDAMDLGDDTTLIRNTMYTARERTPAFVTHPTDEEHD